MKTLVIYDSKYGNTKAIAEAVAKGAGGESTALPVGEADAAALPEFDCIVIGSPTHGGRPTPALQELIDTLPDETLAGKQFASFDTRVPARWVKLIGFAGGRIAKRLKKKGAVQAAPPEGFYVTATEGPLRDGEMERAMEWGRKCGESNDSIG